MGVSYDGKLFERYKNGCKLFIETGSYIGDGIQAAINVGFEKIVSVELGQHHYEFCKKRFEKNNNVELYLGDSRIIMSDILEKYSKYYNDIFFWQDAHCSFGNTVGDVIDNTILIEFDVIIKFLINHNLKAILMIDDLDENLLNKILSFISDKIIVLGREDCINTYTNSIVKNKTILILGVNR